MQRLASSSHKVRTFGHFRQTQAVKRCDYVFTRRLNTSTERNPFHGQSQSLSRHQTAISDDVFQYNGGRFIYDESENIRQRSQRFDIHALIDAAATATGSACIEIRRLQDGTYNRALLLAMEDGSEVVAKIPNPNSGRAHFTIASEVATMDFVSSTLPAETIADVLLGSECPRASCAKGVCLELRFRKPCKGRVHHHGKS
jgi:hypothetical protein